MTFFDIVKIFFPLLLIVGLLYTVLRFVKRTGFSVGSKTSKKYHFNIVNTQMIMPKKYISIIKVKDKLLVLGVSEQSINLLKEMDDDFEYEEPTLKNYQPDNNFLTILKRNLGIR